MPRTEFTNIDGLRISSEFTYIVTGIETKPGANGVRRRGWIINALKVPRTLQGAYLGFVSYHSCGGRIRAWFPNSICTVDGLILTPSSYAEYSQDELRVVA